jgi:lysyl-tRNA synthetase class 2
MLKRAREYFEKRNVLEVDTPALSRFAVSDPHIESIEVDLRLAPGQDWFLQTSPEYFMKRLLAAGYPDIYEICKVFRDSEDGRHHQPEFTLVEWYRLGLGLNDIIQDAADFISCLVDGDRLREAPRSLSYRQAFQDYAGEEYAECDRASLDLMLVEKVLPQFPSDRLTILYHYPANQAALARICPDDASVADRFEVFAGSLELANGYVELVDATEQAERFGNDLTSRKAEGKSIRPLDNGFLAALESGLPACAGVAVGFDRLMMLNTRVDDIRSVLTFPFDRRLQHG